MAVYQSRSIKRSRRTKAELAAILQTTKNIIAEEGQLTIRHLFYRLVGYKLLEKTEQEYSHLVNYLGNWRRTGLVPWSAFADNTRSYYYDAQFDNLESCLCDTRDLYRRDMWRSQKKLVEIWCEKDAIAGLLAGAVNPYGVKVFPCHGFSSLTAIYSASEMFKKYIKNGRSVHIYYFGDRDPSGLSIERSIINSLREDHGIEVDFQRIAILPEQIKEYSLPTRPPKNGDTRAKSFSGEAVDIDTLPISILREMAERCVIRHIDPVIWALSKRIEDREKATLGQIIEAYGEAV